MEAIEETLTKNDGKPLGVGNSLHDTAMADAIDDSDWQPAEELPGFLEPAKMSSTAQFDAEITPVAPFVGHASAPRIRPSKAVLDAYTKHVQNIRAAQGKGKHASAIEMTTRALRLIRSQPKMQRKAMLQQVQELLNLRCLSMIAVGEAGEAWRCVSLMAKLWPRLGSV